ncbi:Rv1476 family membrane protein [Nocardia sp. FBN12]|uniref:Rv1476 family membrane protein n=1 Tax=Nocardia sp. FBN12 TaxID=3419766 RepID=UPI003D042678
MTTFAPMAAELPPNTVLSSVASDLADNHVAAPKGQDQEKLAAIVAQARSEGIPLSVVIVPGNPGHDSSLRDLATEVGESTHGTVAVFSDDWLGTYSDGISRVRLEWAEDAAKYKGNHPEEAVQAFVDRLEQPEGVSWSVITAVMLGLMALAIAGLYLVKVRRGPDVPAVTESPRVDASSAN